MLDKAALDQPLTTPSVSHMFAMERQFTHILDEGMERRWDRHHRMGLTVRAWAKDRFALFADETHASDTLTCVSNTRGIKVAELIGALRKEGMLISNGYGDLKEKAFRIAHLGELGPGDIAQLLSSIDRHLGLS
jgi:aspartate aminotransferase-like enzyme